MVHFMKLWDNPFKSIQSGRKTIEMRLNDEKRKLINVGDDIEFVNVETGEKLRCEVVNLFKYASFDELYLNHNKVSIGYCEDEVADPKDMLKYYSASDIEKYGVLGIEIKLL